MSGNTNYEKSKIRLMVLSDDLTRVEKKKFKNVAYKKLTPIAVYNYADGAYLFDNFGFPIRKREMKALIGLLEKGLDAYSDDEEAEEIKEEIAWEDEILKESMISTPVEKKKDPGYVYVIKGESGRYKIGASKNVEKRVANLRISSSEDHTLVFAYKVDDHYKHEKMTHEAMTLKRMHSEWFELTDEDLGHIETYLQSVCIDKEVLYGKI